MASEMDQFSDMFANMGSFSDAFGMSQINFGEFSGYFGIECGNTLGLGGALFAALLGSTILSKEEKDRTAEFLLSHPIQRWKVVFGKLLSVMAQILIFNAIIAGTCFLATLAIGEKLTGDNLLILLSYALLQIEVFAIAFCISTFMKKGSAGAGIGITMLFYFLNIISNISESVKSTYFCFALQPSLLAVLP